MNAKLQTEKRVAVITGGGHGIGKAIAEMFLADGVTAPFYLSKLLMPLFAENASVIHISSSRDRMSQPQTESYTAAKAG